MQRVKDERGAVGVVVAMLMVPMMGFAAVSIDAAALWTQQLQLQTGADAGALAIAHDCAIGACGTPSQTAQTMATQNMNSDAATATVIALSSSQVTVRNTGIRNYWFAPVLGYESSTITTQATATWGAPIGGTAVSATGLFLLRVPGPDRRPAAVYDCSTPHSFHQELGSSRLHRPVEQRDPRWVRLAHGELWELSYHQRHQRGTCLRSWELRAQFVFEQRPAGSSGQDGAAADLRPGSRVRQQRNLSSVRIRSVHDHRLLLRRAERLEQAVQWERALHQGVLHQVRGDAWTPSTTAPARPSSGSPSSTSLT